MSDLTEKGTRFFGELYGAQSENDLRRAIAEGGGFGHETAKLSTDFAFGTIWSRGGLERRERSLVVLGALIALRQPDEIKYHVRVALANGLTVKELEEVLYQSIPYVGFPAANSAKAAMREALQEVGKAVSEA